MSDVGVDSHVPILALKGLVKQFGGTRAVDRVSMNVEAGEIHALLGENGAGKSTVIGLLAGIHAPDEGAIEWRGAVASPRDRRLPISFIHQDLGLIAPMTVAENIALVNGFPRNHGLISWRAVNRSGAAALSAVGSEIDPTRLVVTLSSAEQSIVAIARALAAQAEVLVLDEPTASLPEADVARLFSVLDHLRDRGLGVIYVTHRLDEVFRMADRITVLRDGRVVAGTLVRDTNPSALVEAIVGKAAATGYEKAKSHGPRVVLELLEAATAFAGPASVRLHAGEVLAFVGLRGAGQASIGRAIAGDEPLISGSIRVNGEIATPRRPSDAIEAGVGFVPSKRREEGLAETMTVRENLYLNPALFGKRLAQPVSRRSEKVAAERLMERFDVRAGSAEQLVSTLSGGNQQKVILARWLELGLGALVLEEPTSGVDVGAKAEIYSLLRRNAEAGRSAIIISSDFEEVVRTSNRAVVFHGGSVSTILEQRDITVTNLTAAAAARGAEPSRLS